MSAVAKAKKASSRTKRVLVAASVAASGVLVPGAINAAKQVAPRVIEYKRPPLTEYQRAAFFGNNRYSAIEATSKAGKSYGAIAWIWEMTALHGYAGSTSLWVAPSYAQTEIMYRRLKLALPAGLCKFNDTSLSVMLPTGARLIFRSGENPDSLYGDDSLCAVIDEASRLRPEAWWAVRSTLTKTNGKARLIGNVKGKKNFFYALCRKAEAGEPDWLYARIVASDAVKAGVITAEEVADAKRILPDSVFRELFLAEAGDDGGNPFGVDFIRACVAPISSKPPVVWGWDLAKSVDWTVGIALDIDGAVCRLSRFQAPWKETVDRIRRETGTCKARVDSTGVGDPVLESLQRGDGPTDAAVMLAADSNYEGQKFTSQSKQQMMEGLAVAIQQKKISFPDGIIPSELESYEYVYSRTGVRYEAAEGFHDDAVCALALAYSGFTAAPKSNVPSWNAWV